MTTPPAPKPTICQGCRDENTRRHVCTYGTCTCQPCLRSLVNRHERGRGGARANRRY